MIRDVLTVMWKERRGFFAAQGGRWRTLFSLISPLFLAVYLPWDAGTRWLTGYPSLVLCSLVSILFTGITIPDSFAGERERHTLATLLASRLPDRAILLGKLFNIILYTVLTVLLALLIGAGVANGVDWQGHLVFYRPLVLVVDLAVVILLTLLVGGVGILISLRSETAQGAAQVLLGSIFMPIMILGFVGLLFREPIRAFISRLDLAQIGWGVVLLIALADIGLLALVFGRFRRGRLLGR
jgi:ABC-2 type transport system permease protein